MSSASQSGINPLNGSDYLNNPTAMVLMSTLMESSQEANNGFEYHVRCLEAGDEITFGITIARWFQYKPI